MKNWQTNGQEPIMSTAVYFIFSLPMGFFFYLSSGPNGRAFSFSSFFLEENVFIPQLVTYIILILFVNVFICLYHWELLMYVLYDAYAFLFFLQIKHFYHSKNLHFTLNHFKKSNTKNNSLFC